MQLGEFVFLKPPPRIQIMTVGFSRPTIDPSALKKANRALRGIWPRLTGVHRRVHAASATACSGNWIVKVLP